MIPEKPKYCSYKDWGGESSNATWDDCVKQYAKYIVDKWPGTTQEDYDYALIEIPRADFEEFQKLASEGG